MRTIKILALALIGVILVVVGGIGANLMTNTEKMPPDLPIRAVKIVIAQDQMEEFFDKIHQFSEKHAFAIRIGQSTDRGYDYLIQLWREDIKVVGANSFDPYVFQIGFYENGAGKIPSEHLDLLVKDLKDLTLELPNAKFTVLELPD